MTTEEKIIKALSRVMDPELHRSLNDLGMVRDIQLQEGTAKVTIALTVPECPLKDRIVSDVKTAVLQVEGVHQVLVELGEMSAKEKRRIGPATPDEAGAAETFNRIQRVVAVMSGKGGVGKSSVTALLATALAKAGNRIGILDADITGPSIPKLFGLTVKPPMTPFGILPAESARGIKIMSINLMLENEDQAVIWRGPLISSAVKQFWGDVYWGELDWLVVDLPPGTSDAVLTVMQSLPLFGVLLVTSPQSLAELVVRKAARMAQAMEVPMLGLVENMSYFLCPDNNKRYDIFGTGRGEELAALLNIPFLARLPLDPVLSQLCDAGRVEEYPSEALTGVVQHLQEYAPRPHRPSL